MGEGIHYEVLKDSKSVRKGYISEEQIDEIIKRNKIIQAKLKRRAVIKKWLQRILITIWFVAIFTYLISSYYEK